MALAPTATTLVLGLLGRLWEMFLSAKQHRPWEGGEGVKGGPASWGRGRTGGPPPCTLEPLSPAYSSRPTFDPPPQGYPLGFRGHPSMLLTNHEIFIGRTKNITMYHYRVIKRHEKVTIHRLDLNEVRQCCCGLLCGSE